MRWAIAGRIESITRELVDQAQASVDDKLDTSFFRVRAERTSELELQYLRAMADLGPGPYRTGDVADLMKRSSEQLGPTRARLIEKGLVYTPGHGQMAFTVPQFDRYMRRSHVLDVPPVGAARKGRKEKTDRN